MKKAENKFDIDKHGNPFPLPAEVAKNLGLNDCKQIDSVATNVTEFAKALLEVQKQLPHAKRDSDNPFFKSSYASHASIWDGCKKALQDNGFCIIQTIHDEASIYLRTRLLHVSGEFMDSECPLLCKETTMQALGSAITYAKRYSLAAIIGIVVDDDDDGNAASQPSVSHETSRPTTFTKITGPQAKRFYAIQMSNKKTDAEVHYYLRTWGYASASDIHPKDYEAMCRGDKAKVSQHKDHEVPPIDDSDIPF